jgi:tetratricopeptide (TPR) repeat protein
LGQTYLVQVNYGARPVEDAVRLAKEAAAKALAIDPNQGQAYGLLGKISRSYDGDFKAAAQYLSRALALAPQDPDVLRQAAVLARGLDRVPLAAKVGEALVAKDPAQAVNYADLALTYLCDHRPDAALAAMRQTLARSSAYLSGQFQVGLALLQKGQAQAALAAMQQEEDEGWRMIGLPMALYAVGRKADSDAALANLIRKYSADSAYNIAYVYAFRNEPDQAFDWLEKAVATRDAGLSTIAAEPLFDPIRKDRRWLPFLTKLGKSPAQLAATKFDVKI